jgi:hypothetical protein
VPDTQLPVVAISAPKHNARVTPNTVVTIQANASDNAGLARVDFFVNNLLTCSDITAPYACAWAVPGTLSGDYVLRAKAVDTSGNIKNAQITVR